MNFDYVIVGGGSAGSTLAGRLSADPATRVCLIEAIEKAIAGGYSKRLIADEEDFESFGRMPRFAAMVWQTSQRRNDEQEEGQAGRQRGAEKTGTEELTAAGRGRLRGGPRRGSGPAATSHITIFLFNTGPGNKIRTAPQRPMPAPASIEWTSSTSSTAATCR